MRIEPIKICDGCLLGNGTPPPDRGDLTEECTCEVHYLLFTFWPDAERYPNAAACRELSQHINIIINSPHTQTLRKPHAGRPQEREVVKSARVLLRHLLELRQHQEQELKDYTISYGDGNIFQSPYCLAVLDQTKHTEQSVQAFLDANRTRLPWRPNAARFIAERVKHAWSSVTGANVSLSVRSDDPLCEFVAAVLGRIELPLAATSVSDILRARVNRPRRRPM